MCKACELAKLVTNKCLDQGFSVDAPKVQKLLVLMHGKSLCQAGMPLFPEKIEVWECGVAIPEVHEAFKAYALGIKNRQKSFLALLDHEKTIIDSVINQFGSKNVFEISADHRLRRIVENYPFISGHRLEVPNEFIRKVFNEYERPM